MGLFGSIKKNLSHGGVKLELSAPASVSMQDGQLTANITITASDAPVTINSLTLEILAQSHNQNFSTNNLNNGANTTTTIHTVAQAQNAQVFSLAAGESKSVPLSIVMNAGAAMQAQLPENSPAASIMHGLQELQSLGEALNSQSYTYQLKASADVEGVALDPAKQQPLQIITPGQLGGAVNIKL